MHQCKWCLLRGHLSARLYICSQYLFEPLRNEALMTHRNLLPNFKIRIVPFSTSALNRRAFKEEALPCSVSDFSHFSLILLNLTADCRPVHLYAVLTRSGIFCPKSLYNAPRQSHSRDKKKTKNSAVLMKCDMTCCNSATFYYMRTHSIIYF